ncbi:CPA1 family monovalent cation:H+ antiporter [Comamonas sp. BIGb0152]|uniref:Na+/H+ antiporter n=1 Tax=Comamonas sp. BIGb0152 TaxID=2940601 RepID=UPI00216A7D78|nr:Na+/H+ antiporter [Comamonas sp. BIGb0152]MCS4292467.1 CPA1 family monovalent cation:H+ antiporter [Comamonas sp. BIGb0152]
MHTVETVLLVLMIGAVTGIIARYIRAIPLPLIQIMLGAALSWPQKGLHIDFDPGLFMLLFIPPLLFADGWRIPKREFFALYRPILRLAFGLVLFTVIGMGYLIHWMIPEIPLTVAFALAAVISPTDAVAVSAITRNLGMPAHTMHVLEGESLLNDASGLVALKFAIAATLTGLFSWTEVTQEFLWIALGGLAVGAAVGWGFSYLRDTVTRRLGDVAATQMVLLLVLLPFAAYLLGEKFGVSGILAAVAAGVATNFGDLNRADYISERMQTAGTWAMVESAFNGAIFLLLGLQLPSIIGVTLRDAGHDWWILVGYVAIISIALLALRWIWLMLGVSRSLHKAHQAGKLVKKPDLWLNLATTLAGIRGAVTLAGALSVPLLLNNGQPFPARDMLIFLATGTILFTLVIGSIGLPLVLRRVQAVSEPESVREERQARIAACRAAINSLAMSDEDAAQQPTEWQAQQHEIEGRIAREYRSRIDLLDEERTPESAEMQDLATPDAVQERRLRYVAELEMRLNCIKVERHTIYAERHNNRINDESLRSLVQELDLSEITLRKRLEVARRAAAKQAAKLEGH